MYPHAVSAHGSLVLEGFVDSLWGACTTTRQSYMWYVFRLGDCTISWKARKQQSVATSTTEAEYMAMSLGAKHMMWYKKGLRELRVHLPNGYAIPVALWPESQGAIDLVINPRISDRSRHIDIQYHYTRERVYAGVFSLVYVPTRDNLADIFTKALPKPVHYRLSSPIRGSVLQREEASCHCCRLHKSAIDRGKRLIGILGKVWA